MDKFWRVKTSSEALPRTVEHIRELGRDKGTAKLYPALK